MATSENTRKITISLPEELVVFADDRAREWNTSRSQAIGMALAAVRTAEQARLAADGYRFYAQEASEFADTIGKAIAEAWANSSAHRSRPKPTLPGNSI